MPTSNAVMGSGDILRSSPKSDLPARNVDFLEEGTSTEAGPIYGVYKKLGWKTWNNDDQSVEVSKDIIGRRYLPADNECKMRNTLITVLATENDAQLLIELQSAKFNAVYIKNAMLAAVVSSLFLF